MNLEDRVESCRTRAAAWLDSMVLEPGRPERVRFSPFHDPDRWPGMLLPASYDALHCRILLGSWNREDSARAVDYLNGFQGADGAYRLPGMDPGSVYKGPDPARTREYIDLHATNYAWGAVRSLGGRERFQLAFLDRYLTREGLAEWTARRDWDDPWMEGNLVVNLGSFLVAWAEDGDARAAARLPELFAWLDGIQDEATGFWGTRMESRRDILEAMAGAMHTYHLYYRTGRELRHLDRIAEHCVSLARNELRPVTSACLDVDIVDVLANVHRLGLRRTEIEGILEEKLELLLDFQNPDGGFPDERGGILRFDGWVGGYWEPQGRSNCFATWFRCAAVAVASCILFPHTASTWKFRNTTGIGYYPNDGKAS